MITNPIKIVSTVFQDSQQTFLFQLFLPVGFLPLLSPHILLFALPDLLINLLSNNAQLRQIYYHYAATITPFLFIATIYSLRQLLRVRFQFAAKFLGIYLVLATFLSAYFFGPLPGSKNPNIDMITKPLTYRDTIHNYLKQIPKDKIVAATNNLGAHLSQRQQFYTIPLGVNKADVLVFLLNDVFAQPSLAHQKQMVTNLKRDPSYKLVFHEQDFFVFEERKNK